MYLFFTVTYQCYKMCSSRLSQRESLCIIDYNIKDPDSHNSWANNVLIFKLRQ